MQFLLSLLLAALALGTPEVAAAPAPAPTVYWGAYVQDVPWDSTRLAAFEQEAGKGQSIINFGNPWFHAGVAETFPASIMTTVRDHGSIPMVSWASFDDTRQTSPIVQPEYSLAAIYNGKYDPFITQWAHSAKQWGHPFFLRFDWEMNGDWRFPYSESVNGNQPGDFVKMWRHVHDIFVREGATNVTWVWNPNYSTPSETPMAELYPGSDYVDWTALDGYNWGVDAIGNKWQSFPQIFSGIAPATYGGQNSYKLILDLAWNKPVMIAETATAVHGGSPSAWILDTLTHQIPDNFTMIRAIVWMDWNGGDPSVSWAIDSTPAEEQAFRQGIGSPFYASNQFANLAGSGKVLPLK